MIRARNNEFNQKVNRLRRWQTSISKISSHSRSNSGSFYAEEWEKGGATGVPAEQGCYSSFLPHPITVLIKLCIYIWIMLFGGLPSGTVGKNPPANAGDTRHMGVISRSRRSFGGGNGNPLQYSLLEDCMNREAWWATVHGGQTHSAIWKS